MSCLNINHVYNVIMYTYQNIYLKKMLSKYFDISWILYNLLNYQINNNI